MAARESTIGAPTRAYRDPGIVLLALLLWSIPAIPTFWALGAAWLLAWVVFEAAARLRIERSRLRLTRPRALLLALVVLALPVFRFTQVGAYFVHNEKLRGVWENTTDRLRLERLPSIAPPVVFGDHPQELYVHAPDATRVSLGLGPGGPVLEAVLVGEGLFRVRYDPRRDGSPVPVSGIVDAELRVDDAMHTRILTSIQPFAHPRRFCSQPEAGLAATVSEETDELIVVTAAGALRRIAVGDAPTDCALLEDGRFAAVSHRFGDGVWIVDLGRGVPVRRFDLPPFQESIARSPDGSLLAVAMAGDSPGIGFVDLARNDGTLLPTPVPPDRLEFGPNADVLVVTSKQTGRLYKLVRSERGWEFGAEALRFARPILALARSPEGDRVYASTTDYRPDGTPRKQNHFIEDQILAVDIERFEVVARRVTARGGRLHASEAELDGRGGSPLGLAVLRDGSVLAAFAGTDELWRLSADLSEVEWAATSLGSVDPRGHAQARVALSLPQGVADLGNGSWAVASPGSGEIAIVTAGASARVHRLDEVGLDPQARMRRRGEQAFYESTRGGLSCQSCHPRAGSDHSLHDIGTGILLEPLDVRGIARTAPYLRDASYPGIDALNHLAMTTFRGYRRELPDRAEALEAYIFGLARPVNPRLLLGRDAERESRGASVFVDAGCTRCHAFPALTNLSQHAAETIFPEWAPRLRPRIQLDVPSLFGVHGSAPFLNDGRAGTLEDVMREHNPRNLHGDTAELSDAEVEALAYFLKGI